MKKYYKKQKLKHRQQQNIVYNIQTQSKCISFPSIQDHQIKLIAQIHLPNITVLKFSYHFLKKQGIQAIVNKQWNLQEIYLDNQKASTSLEKIVGIKISGAKKLSLGKWQNLSILNLRGNQIDDQGVVYLTRSNWLNLKELNLQNNRISDTGGVLLTRGKWQLLVVLVLSENKLSDLSMKVYKKGRWSGLKKFELKDNEIGDNGIDCILQFCWQDLQHLSLGGNKFSISKEDVLRKRYGALLIL